MLQINNASCHKSQMHTSILTRSPLFLFLSLSVCVSARAAIAAEAPPRERLLMDFGWRFQPGDPADAGKIFDYPEVKSLGKTNAEDIEQEAKLAAGQPDPVANNLGGGVSFVKNDFDDKNW